MTSNDAERQLQAHVERFNRGVRAGDFTEMVSHLAPDAEMHVAGVPAGPFIGKAAIDEAYRATPPDDEIVLLNANADGDSAAGDYAWRRDPATTAGRIAMRLDGDRITRLEVTFL